MATFATLPGDVLTAIASYVDTPHFVVAVASDADARVAVVVFFRDCSLLVLFGFLLPCRCSWDCRVVGLFVAR